MQDIACDSHKRYTLASVEPAAGGPAREVRIDHERGALRDFLHGCERGSPVAVETIGSWYWIVEELEAAGMVPQLVHARKAKLMMGMLNKTDKLDARGRNRLQRTGTLPTVWIPPGALRDQRDLPRTRMVLVQQRTRLKNRIQATLAKYAVNVCEGSDLFGGRGQDWLRTQRAELPEHTRSVTEQLLAQVATLTAHVEQLEARRRSVCAPTREIELWRTLPGVRFTLAVVIAWEVGTVERFATAERLASYAGTTPRIHASGGKTRYGQLRPDVNRYLKGAFIEAANSLCRHRQHWPQRHVSRLYERIRARKGHPKAIGAVARHLAEATYWILTKQEAYRDPAAPQVSSMAGEARGTHGPFEVRAMIVTP